MAHHTVMVRLSPSEEERVLELGGHSVDKGCVVLTGSFQQCIDQYVALEKALEKREETVAISLPDTYCIKVMAHKDWFRHADEYRLQMIAQSDDTVTLKCPTSFIPILEDCVVGGPIDDRFTTCDWFNATVIELRSVFEILVKTDNVSNEQWNDFHDSLQVIGEAIPSRWATQLSSLDAGDSVYLVKYSGEWHRAQHAGGNKSYLLDMGQVVEGECIVQPSNSTILSRCPYLVRDCMLDRVDQIDGKQSDPDDSRWSDEANNALNGVLKQHKDGLQCRCTRVVPFGKHVVCLVDFRSKTCSSIALAFVDTGFAIGF